MLRYRSTVHAAMVLALAIMFPAFRAAAQGNGTSVNPFTTLFQWNRADLSQFTRTDVGSAAYVLNELVRTTQPDYTWGVLPAAEWTTTTGTGAPQYRYLMTNDAFAPAAGELLVIEADIGYGSLEADKNGLACFDPANPANNYFVVTHRRDYFGFQVNKYINGTFYAQTAIVQSAAATSSFKMQKPRIRLTLDTNGRVQLYTGNMVLADLPMTLGNGTMITSCKVGFVIAAANGPFSFSRLRVFRMAPAGLQLFGAQAPQKEDR